VLGGGEKDFQIRHLHELWRSGVLARVRAMDWETEDTLWRVLGKKIRRGGAATSERKKRSVLGERYGK